MSVPLADNLVDHEGPEAEVGIKVKDGPLSGDLDHKAGQNKIFPRWFIQFVRFVNFYSEQEYSCIVTQYLWLWMWIMSICIPSLYKSKISFQSLHVVIEVKKSWFSLFSSCYERINHLTELSFNRTNVQEEADLPETVVYDRNAQTRSRFSPSWPDDSISPTTQLRQSKDYKLTNNLEFLSKWAFTIITWFILNPDSLYIFFSELGTSLVTLIWLQEIIPRMFYTPTCEMMMIFWPKVTFQSFYDDWPKVLMVSKTLFPHSAVKVGNIIHVVRKDQP